MSFIKTHTHPNKLEWYSFMWSQARLVLASIALFIGGIPVLWKFMSSSSSVFGLANSLLGLSWIISGLASAYLLYRWNIGGQKLFGKKERMDSIAFFVSIISGFNLGLAGITGNNIGMSISGMSQILFVITGIVYIATMVYLHKQWNANGKKMF